MVSRRWNAYTACVFRAVYSWRMRRRSIWIPLAGILLLSSFLPIHAAQTPPSGILKARGDYRLHYAAADRARAAEYESFLAKGIAANETFFQSRYPKQFDVYIHPNRASFDSALEKEFHKPDFRSECWLVAIGQSSGIHILAPARWDDGTCEGRYTTYADKEKTQKLITHELTHVFQGQSMRGHRPDNKKDISWFEEGLAVYVSGQLGSSEGHDVQTALQNLTIPGSLHDIATSESILLRYSMMGSLVLYIDRTYGRAKLKNLLQFDSQEELLSSLGVTEPQFLDGWKHFMLSSAGISR